MEKFNDKTLDYISQGSTLMATENYDEAVKMFEKAVAESPKYVECYINLGNAYASIEEFEKALEAFKKGLILESKNVEILFGIGNLYYLQGDLTSAIKYYNKAEETNEMTDEMYEVLAGIFEDADDYVQALRYINKAIMINPLNGNYYLQKTRIFIDQQKADEAIEVLKELNEVLPDAYEAYDMLSEIYTIKEDYNKALEVVDKAIDKFPDDPNIAYLKLKVLVKFKKDDEAKSFIEKMKSSGLYNERSEDNVLLEADILVRENKLQSAADCLETVAKGEYKNSQIAFVLINIYMSLLNYEQVEKITANMMTYENDIFYNATAKFYHAEALFKQGKEEAKNELKNLVKVLRSYTISDPSFYQGYIYRVLTHKELEEYSEALSLTDYIELLFPERPDSYILKYAIYLDQNDTEKANAIKEKIKDIDPSFAI
jgi:tetratricopeptide (TPR) repeat protein